jgi:hypothetical protein
MDGLDENDTADRVSETGEGGPSMDLEPRLYRKRPVEVEALQWDPSTKEGIAAMLRFCPVAGLPPSPTPARWVPTPNLKLHVKTLEGWLEASPGDYIVRGVRGEFYPVKPDIFEATYERVYED